MANSVKGNEMLWTPKLKVTRETACCKAVHYNVEIMVNVQRGVVNWQNKRVTYFLFFLSDVCKWQSYQI